MVDWLIQWLTLEKMQTFFEENSTWNLPFPWRNVVHWEWDGGWSDDILRRGTRWGSDRVGPEHERPLRSTRGAPSSWGRRNWAWPVDARPTAAVTDEKLNKKIKKIKWWRNGEFSKSINPLERLTNKRQTNQSIDGSTNRTNDKARIDRSNHWPIYCWSINR